MFAQEDRTQRAQSQGIARAEFVNQIPNLRPDCLKDLASTFYQFLLVVCAVFRDELMKGCDQPANSSHEVLYSQFNKALKQLITPEAVNLSIGDVLCVMFGKFQVVESTALEGAIPNWKSLTQLDGAYTLCKQLSHWSKKWNLDEDWCRDHALTTLRNLLTDEYLKWSFLRHMNSMLSLYQEWQKSDPRSPEPQLDFVSFLFVRALESIVTHPMNMKKAWDQASTDIKINVFAVQFFLSVEMHGKHGDPKPLEFESQDIRFTCPGFNSIRHSQTDYEELVTAEFRLVLNKWERDQILEWLKSDGQKTKSVPSTHGILTRFRETLKKHIEEQNRRTGPFQKRLVKVTPRPRLTEHLNWTIDYQLPPTQGLVDIAAAHDADTSTVARAVNDSLHLIGLTKRPDAKPGRIAGRKNTYSKTLKHLGR